MILEVFYALLTLIDPLYIVPSTFLHFWEKFVNFIAE